MSGLRHPHVIELIGTERRKDALYILMEYASMGSLADLARKEGGLSEAHACGYLEQIATGLA
eukprot:CAMPEP_0206259298 /NCGR_PEP_ID=MMETSP0047_2-20121206/26407_1 /ASSEMBLY_ACC=CAM_ASM_000192 /TAXON_ID=195065 /ORGANISM="Chroomonas mesostigmatica_cf, Strain CCMP1168" /LENGTH=61 /DNA_ID=CAMNT_0053686157 /DNA_START=48 /DNA_END=230 /DNA_ORIENTATION=-